MKLWNKVFGGKYPPKAIMGTGLAISFSGVPVLACGVFCPPLLIPGAILYLGGSGITVASFGAWLFTERKY